MVIPSNRLDRFFLAHKNEYESKALAVLNSSSYILGKEVSAFEQEFARFCEAKYCVGVACGLDSLWIALHLLGVKHGDEVLVQGNTFIATAIAVSRVGAVPVFVDVTDNYCVDVDDLRRKIGKKTKAVIVTHLYGMATPMEPIVSLCEVFGLNLIEDCAQAHGATYGKQKVGTFGDAGCFSFYPTKNLGAFGDGGGIILNDEVLAEKARIFRNYGNLGKNETVEIGTNSRLDELQAGLLRIRLKYLSEMTDEKKKLANAYLNGIHNKKIKLPTLDPESSPVWHQFVIRCESRDDLRQYLSEKGIQTDIHYLVPPHLSPAYRKSLGAVSLPMVELLSQQILSLPVFYGMTNEEQRYIIQQLNLY